MDNPHYNRTKAVLAKKDKIDPTGIEVKVASDDSIEYEGRIYKLSPFVDTFLCRKSSAMPPVPTRVPSTSRITGK